MKNTLFAITLLALIGLGIHHHLQIQETKAQYEHLEEATLKVVKRIDEQFQTLNELAVGRENALQDSLEERIGTIERDMEDLKFLFQPKKRK